MLLIFLITIIQNYYIYSQTSFQGQLLKYIFYYTQNYLNFLKISIDVALFLVSQDYRTLMCYVSILSIILHYFMFQFTSQVCYLDINYLLINITSICIQIHYRMLYQFCQNFSGFIKFNYCKFFFFKQHYQIQQLTTKKVTNTHRKTQKAEVLVNMNFLEKIDFFSSQFTFYLSKQSFKRDTLLGSLISQFIIAILLSYLIYLVLQLLNNKIDPKFRSQVFILDEPTHVALQNDLLAFKFQYQPQISLEEYQIYMNKTYFVPIVYFMLYDTENATQILLNITKCSNKDLQKYDCIDFSNLSNYTLFQNQKQRASSKIYLLIFSLFYY
ncbi:hypothetical protein ABPG72_001733 [Tetrahymena utriculariae]